MTQTHPYFLSVPCLQYPGRPREDLPNWDLGWLVVGRPDCLRRSRVMIPLRPPVDALALLLHWGSIGRQLQSMYLCGDLLRRGIVRGPRQKSEKNLVGDFVGALS